MKDVEKKTTHPRSDQINHDRGTIHDRMNLGDFIESPVDWNKQLPRKTRGWLNYQ